MGDERDETRNEPSSGSVPPPADKDRDERRRIYERAVPELLKRIVERAVESGVEKLSELGEKPDTLRSYLSELRLPKEVLADVYAQIDDTKNGLYRVVAKEIRDVLEHTAIADEIAKVLTKLSFEIKTEIRFVPNDRAAGEEGEVDGAAAAPRDPAAPVKPKITSEVTVKDRSNEARRGSR